MSAITIRSPVNATDLPASDVLIDSEKRITGAQTADVFPQSVASGGPTSTGVVLWTRIDPEWYDPEETLRLEVAADEGFEDLVTRVELPGTGVKSTDNYTVRVNLDGQLAPDSVYYYRFGYRGVRSRTGRCRTLPTEDASPDALSFGVLNCQNYQNGYFAAMNYLAESDVDFVLHLGDYVYEHVAEGYPHGADGPYKDRRIDLPDGETLPMSLEDFRRIYETYKSDPFLQRLHERHTVIQTWDDHAIANDRYWDYEADAPVFPKHPCGNVPEFTRYLTRAGIQAWWEFIPAHLTYERDAEHIHDSFVLHQSARFGDLVTLLLTDERLFRSEPLSIADKLSPRRGRFDPSRTMLGAEQREWFLAELRGSDTAWTVWANAVLFTPLTLGVRRLTPWGDSWDGFEAERRDIVSTLGEVRRRGATTVVTLTGDMHTTLATLVRDEDATPVAAEFMTPGVTSVNFGEKIARKVRYGPFSRLVGQHAPRLVGAVLRRLNADYDVFDSAHWGYSVVTFSREACTWEVYWVDKTVNAADATRTPVYRVRVPAGRYEIRNESDSLAESGVSKRSDPP